MGNENIVRKIFGKIIKWFFLVGALNFVFILFLAIAQSMFDGIGYCVLLAALCGLFAFAGYRIEKGGKGGKKAAAEKPGFTAPQPREKKPAAQPDYRPVRSRTGVVKNGEFIYEFKKGADLFADGKEGLAYPELPWNFQVAANLGKHILDNGGLIRSIYIGGGSDEVAHTGAVAYSAGYRSLESFVENCRKDLDDAESDAGREYGCWFSSLDYKYIIIEAKIKETDVKVEVSCFVSTITVWIRLENASEGFSYLTDLVRRFGAKDFHQGVGADELRWDPSLKIFRRTFQLEETRTLFLTSYMNAEGDFLKYSLDVNAAEDAHYEILPKKMDQLAQILKETMNQRYLQNPEVSCAYYLQRHSGSDLIALLKQHHFIHREFHSE